jgi:hypothetical protein
MNITEIQLVQLLLSAIHEGKKEIDSTQIIKWKSIIAEAEAHNVKGLLYSAINKSEYLKYVEKESLEQWKRDTLFTGISQIEHIRQISKVLKVFNKENISVIALKGLVVRNFYPNPELRTMSDADVLVKREDLNRVKKLLNDLGYIEAETTEAHIVFEHAGHYDIEVHWTLTDMNYFKGQPVFENQIWENTIKVKVGDSEALSLSFEDLAVHLCIHMAVHSVSSGFGVRQLCDLVLLVEKKGHLIDWSSFLNKIKKCGIEKFTISIFLVCTQLFNMTIPKALNNIKLVEEELLTLLINDIFSSGVHGKRSISRMFGNQLAYNSSNLDSLNSVGIVKKFIMLLFSPNNKLSDRYSYAKKNIILLPIAWIHHFGRGVFNKEYSFLSKIKFLVATVYTSKRKNKLLQELELK